MPAACQACTAVASVFCAQDACWLCEACDQKAHCGPLTSSHGRVPACAVCVERPATVYCRNDTAYLCAGCSDECHAGLPLRHNIVPAAQAVKEGLKPSAAAGAAPAPAHEHSACGESSPSLACGEPSHACGASAAPAKAPAARRVSEDSAQRVPVFDASGVPPALDCELPKGQPLDKAALAKSIWGKDLEGLEMDSTWLDRLDMGFDFADDVLADLTAADGLVPCISDDAGMVPGSAGAPPSPTAAQLDQQLSMAKAPAPGSGKAQQAAAALATLERQTTDEFFAALAADDFAVPTLPAPAAPAGVVYVPSAPAAARDRKSVV